MKHSFLLKILVGILVASIDALKIHSKISWDVNKFVKKSASTVAALFILNGLLGQASDAAVSS